jgi:hypothetical protein
LIEARPEVIAQRVSLEEAKSRSEFESRLAAIVESLSTNADDASAPQRIAVLNELFKHRQHLILGSEQIKAGVVTAQRANASRRSGGEP